MRALILDDSGFVDTTDIRVVESARARKRSMWLELKREDLVTKKLLAETFLLHPLVVEDIWQDCQLPKVADFDAFVQLSAHSIHPSSVPEKITFDELDVVLGTNFVVTRVHGNSQITLDDQRARRLLEKGPAWIAHALLDRLVDDYVPLLAHVDQKISDLEAEIVSKAGAPGGGGLINRIFALKRSLQLLRRTSVHQREIFLRLSRGEFEEVPNDSLPFFRDVYDHFVRVTDLADGHRESLSALMDGFWSVQSHRMNEVMKTLTLMSTIMLPLTFIAGVYGMNFDGMPELHHRYGYPMALGLMACVAAGIYLWFRSKKWL
jgi:magnesium transporter